MPRRKIFPSFSVPPRTAESKEEKHTVSPLLTAQRLQAVPVEESTFAISTGQNLAGIEIASSIRSIKELAEHSYSHVIRIDRPSFRRAGNGG
jgi:hypothetical protein